MASSESNLYPNVSFSSRQQVKAVPIVTVTTPILVVHAQTQRTVRLQKSYIPQYFPYRPPMAMAERPFSILKVIVAAPFFSSCYFKVEFRGGKKNRFFDLSRFSLERFCLDLEKFIIDFSIFFFFTHPFCVEMQAASIIALFIESHNCDKEKLFL